MKTNGFVDTEYVNRPRVIATIVSRNHAVRDDYNVISILYSADSSAKIIGRPIHLKLHVDMTV